MNDPQGVQPIGIHHVTLQVKDIDTCVDFYTRVLGFSVRNDRPDLPLPGAWLNAGHHQVHLLKSTTNFRHVALQVSDIDAAVATIRAAGVSVGDPVVASSGSRQTSLFFDPSGNAFELFLPSPAG